MQHPAIQIRDRLLAGLDKEYNVVDMGVVVEVISELETYAITKEALETTRLGKHINELRRKASDRQLANRAKSLVKKWRQLLMPGGGNNGHHNNHHVHAEDASNKKLPPLANGHHQRLSSSANATPRPTPCNSSLPSSASSSPGLSRPTTPTANGTSRPVSPAVPRTSAANKRLRKEDDAEPPPAKKQQLMTNGDASQQSEISICDSTLAAAAPTPNNNHNSTTAATPSTRGQKRKRERENVLQQQLLSAQKSASKVKTTHELVQELALRSATPTLTTTRSKIKPCVTQVNETKTELMNRFFDSQSQAAVLSPPISGSPSPEPEAAKNNGLQTDTTKAADITSEVDTVKESVDEVLAQLPKIDSAAILAAINDDMDEVEEEAEDIEGLIPVKKPEPLDDEVTAAMVQELHSGQHESVNGNFSHNGVFREWHQVVSKETTQGDLLFILPYSVID